MRRSSEFQDIPDEIVVFVESGKIVVAAALDADQGDPIGVNALQGLTLFDGDESIGRAV